MKALSIIQPWAWAIIHAGKPVENRSWRSDYRGPLLIHAGKKYDMDGKRWIESEMGIKVPADLPRGGIIGRVNMIDCRPANIPSRWFFGPFGFVFENPQELQFYPCRGQLGIFDAPLQEAIL